MNLIDDREKFGCYEMLERKRKSLIDEKGEIGKGLTRDMKEKRLGEMHLRTTH